MRYHYSFWVVAVALIAIAPVATVTESALGQVILRVDGDNGGGPGADGSAWGALAFKDLQVALDTASGIGSEVHIWVAATDPGNPYVPTDMTVPRFEASKTFKLLNNVHIYGGFAGNETELYERDPESNVTVLSGALTPGTDGSCFECPEEVPGCDEAACEAVVCAQPNMEYCCTFEWDTHCAEVACETDECTFPADNAWHVVTAIGVGNEARINGFTITGGFAKDDSDCPSCANGSAPGWDDIHRNGGGMLIVNASPVVARCRFEFNDAEIAGGAMFVSGGTAAPELFNNTFAGNTTATGHGGAIAIDGAMADIVNCLFHHNESPTLGAAVWTTGGADVFIVNSTFANNIMHWDDCDKGCTGSLASCHGAVYTAHCDDVMHVANSVFWNNHLQDGSGTCDDSFSFGSVEESGEPNCDEFSDWLVEYSYFPELLGESYMGSGNVSNDRDPFIASNNDNYRINVNSNQGLACIDTGDNDLAVFDKWNMLDDPGWTYQPDRGKNPDLDLNPRVVRNYVDMGAFEHQFCVCPADLDGNGVVDGADLAILLGSWGTCSDCNNCPEDLTLDCEVDGADLAILLASWGPCPDCYEPQESSGGGGGELNGMGGDSFLEWLLYEATFAEILEWMASQMS